MKRIYLALLVLLTAAPTWAAQGTWEVYTGATAPGATTIPAVKTALQAAHTSHSGGTAPTYVAEGMVWYDTDDNILKVYNGSGWVSLFDSTTTGTLYGDYWRPSTAAGPIVYGYAGDAEIFTISDYSTDRVTISTSASAAALTLQFRDNAGVATLVFDHDAFAPFALNHALDIGELDVDTIGDGTDGTDALTIADTGAVSLVGNPSFATGVTGACAIGYGSSNATSVVHTWTDGANALTLTVDHDALYGFALDHHLYVTGQVAATGQVQGGPVVSNSYVTAQTSLTADSGGTGSEATYYLAGALADADGKDDQALAIRADNTSGVYDRMSFWGSNGSDDDSVEMMELSTSFTVPAKLSAAPVILSTPEGAIYYDTTDHKHYGFNGTAWTAMY